MSTIEHHRASAEESIQQLTATGHHISFACKSSSQVGKEWLQVGAQLQFLSLWALPCHDIVSSAISWDIWDDLLVISWHVTTLFHLFHLAGRCSEWSMGLEELERLGWQGLALKNTVVLCSSYDDNDNRNRHSLKIQKDPKRSKQIQKDPKRSKKIQKEPKRAKKIPKDPKRSKKIQTDPKRSKQIQTDPKRSKKIQNDPKRSKKIQHDPKRSKKIQKDTKRSKQIKKIQKRSKKI